MRAISLPPALRAVLVLAFGLALLSGCTASATDIGPRPATDLMTVVEAYLQQYQPGPLPRLFQTTYVYDRHGRVLAELFDEGRRTWVPLDQVSPYLIEATIATEDASFFSNPGVDPRRIVGALVQNVQEGQVVSGASTITMQLARNLFLGPEERYRQDVDRKILEVGLAQELTEKFTKAEILEMYLNLLNYGHLAYGPEAAAQIYFGKPARDLTLAEATLLAGIPQQPANLDLFTNLDRAKARQRVVLSLMVRHGYLTQEEADAVYREPITLNPDPDRALREAPHFVQYVLADLEDRLGREYVRRAGLRIYTTLDLDLQRTAEQVLRDKVAELAPTYGMDNAALVALKPGTAEVLAMVGSVDFDNEAIQGQVNVAVSRRQPGSSIKPVLYATALNDLRISPATVIWDTPVTYTVGVGQVYRPLNYDRKFHGPVTARSALANSYNVPAVKLLAAVGVPRMLESAQAMGIRSLDRGPTWYGLSLTLGGGEVTLLDLATAYHTLANQGRYLPPQTILAITDSQGRSLLEEPPPQPVPVISPEAAYLVTDILSDNNARIPMFGARSFLVLDRPAAAKTGTTDDNRDAWTMGYTRYLVAGVWTGNTDGRPMRNATGARAAAPIWNAFMRAVLQDPELLAELGAPQDPAAWEFPRPDGVVVQDVCPPGLTCRPNGELFSQAWLERMGEAGPLADSVVEIPSAPVYLQTAEGARLTGFCGYPQGATRRLLRLPDSLGQTEVTLQDGPSTPEAAPAPTEEQRYERVGALRWAMERNVPVYLGPCQELERWASVYGLRLAVDLANAGNPEIGETPGGELVEIANPILTGDFPYVLAEPIRHDANCPGSYVMGRVLTWEGQPVPGVRAVLEDPWGNRYETVSKPGPGDAGNFDFPLYSSTPQDLRLTLVDGAGNPISPTVIIPHNRDDASRQPCHHVVFRGG